MKIIYLKRIFNKTEVLSVCKIIDKKGTLSVHSNDISFFPNMDMSEDKLQDGFVEATKEEFDNFFINNAKVINSLSNL